MTFPKPRRERRRPKPIRRHARPRKQRKSTVAQLKRELWKLLKGYVRETWGNTCFTCDAQGLEGSNWHTAHFVNAGKSEATRFDPDNLRPCCGRCNIFLRGNLAEYAIRLLDQIGEQKFRALMARSRQIKKWTAPELERLICALRDGGGSAYELAFYGEFL